MSISFFVCSFQGASALFPLSPSTALSLKSGGHLLSHTVTSVVPSAARALTIVFGMGTGVAPGRIAARNMAVIYCCSTLVPGLNLSRIRFAPSR